jgi:mannose-1-phosphate guanylyltransferase
MLEEAVHRVEPLFGADSVYLATSGYLAEILGSAGTVAQERILAEPAKRNTLGCLCWVAANLIARGFGEATVAVLTADHRIGSPDKFRATVTAALEVSELHSTIVTIGIKPDRPETGFGYIEVDWSEAVRTESGRTAFGVSRFREKPNTDTVLEFLEAGNFLWNSGMFFYPLPAFMSGLSSVAPKVHDLTNHISQAISRQDAMLAKALFEQLPNISVDYALMERIDHAYVVPADFEWDDLGSWDALERNLTPDGHDNVVEGVATLVKSRECVVYNTTGRPVGILGGDGLVVVVTEHGVLVCPKEQAQFVREIAHRSQANSSL